MSESARRDILVLQLVLLAAPISVLALYGLFLTAISTFTRYNFYLHFTMGMSSLSLVCGWRLALAFVDGGSAGLAIVPWYWWLGSLFGVVVAAVAVAAYFMPNLHERWDLFMGAPGVPLLITFAHLTAERLVHPNKSYMDSPRK